jgi:hypothetical protein
MVSAALLLLLLLLLLLSSIAFCSTCKELGAAVLGCG